MLSILSLDAAVRLRDEIDVRQRAQAGVESGPLSIVANFNGDQFDVEVLVDNRAARNALRELLKAEIEVRRATLRGMGVDPEPPQ